jgi:hypothetical protein
MKGVEEWLAQMKNDELKQKSRAGLRRMRRKVSEA